MVGSDGVPGKAGIWRKWPERRGIEQIGVVAVRRPATPLSA
jgi:hypothetical protein